MMDFPPPFIIKHALLPHKQTFILLHGRGSTGEKFGSVLLETPIAPTEKKPSTLRTLFPHARFVFPTAAWRRATIYQRAYTHQWLNNWKLDPSATERDELQIDGLRETTVFLHDLLCAEINLLGGDARNVIFGGLSQGCAASLVAMLLWEGDKLGAWAGMCGWLPFAERLIEEMQAEDKGGDGDFDPFARDEYDDGEHADVGLDDTPAGRAIAWLREELDFPSSASGPASSPSIPPLLDTPLFWGHGVQDNRVSILLGRRGWECLRVMGGQLSSVEYKALRHWYSPEMLRDLAMFLQHQAGMNIDE